VSSLPLMDSVVLNEQRPRPGSGPYFLDASGRKIVVLSTDFFTLPCRDLCFNVGKTFKTSHYT
jgi:hypothetical protein